MIRINLLPAQGDRARASGAASRCRWSPSALAIALLIMVVPFLIQGRTAGARSTREIEPLNQGDPGVNLQVREVRDSIA